MFLPLIAPAGQSRANVTLSSSVRQQFIRNETESLTPHDEREQRAWLM